MTVRSKARQYSVMRSFVLIHRTIATSFFVAFLCWSLTCCHALENVRSVVQDLHTLASKLKEGSAEHVGMLQEILKHDPSDALAIQMLQKIHSFNQLQQKRQQAYSFAHGSPEQVSAWEGILAQFPSNLEARVMLGSIYLQINDAAKKERGATLLEEMFQPNVTYPVMDLADPQMQPAIYLTALLGRYRMQQKQYHKSKTYLEIAFEASKKYEPDGNVCMHLMLASLWDYWPLTTEAADQALDEMNQWADSLLHNRSETKLDEAYMSKAMPGFEGDPWVTCLQGPFTLSLYYRANTAQVARENFEIGAKVWPKLLWTAPHVAEFDSGNADDSCRKVKLAVISAVLTEGHSVTEDFQGVLQRLDRNLFDVTYIYLEERIGKLAKFMYHHKADKVLHYQKRLPMENGRGDWILRMGQDIAELKFDTILYLDMTMSSFCRRLGMMRLAPVQLNTHGHPVTSGHPSDIMQYFVSWEEAEIPEAQNHYTEELRLIPNGKIHQYYTPRVLDGKRSRMDGMTFGHLTRKDFGLPAGSIYLNMQKPFKIHPEYDPLLCGILARDRNGYLVLHRADTTFTDSQGGSEHQIFVQRLTDAKCDMERVIFLTVQPHHRLMALTRLSTLVLDSYPAGGCTTTREVLEMGKAVVTLPAHLLGARWSLGLYSILGLDDLPVIAKTTEEYVELAVALGTNSSLREAVEGRIAEAAPKLFHREEAVAEWQRILLDVSPVRPCRHDEL